MSICPRCQKAFSCGMVNGSQDEPCWCMKQAPVPAVLLRSADGNLEKECLCADCLRLLRLTPKGHQTLSDS